MNVSGPSAGLKQLLSEQPGEEQLALSALQITLLRLSDIMTLRACGFIIFRRLVQHPFPGNIEYLLLQTSYGEHHWTPPKGHVDPGEDDLTTAWRETQEEAGFSEEHLRVVDGFLQSLHYQVRGKEKEVVYWLAELREPGTKVKLSDEHRDYRWARLDEACRLAKYTDLQDTLKNVQRFLEKAEKKQ
ncbi:bis(5'-nucleosyl)-tetraphosphatase [asymmetrical] [Silurus meridionalis]|nr:bis(5'-nucleosyl)-tetraphosphatase [asymmetrical] [Silurus meridionalis]